MYIPNCQSTYNLLRGLRVLVSAVLASALNLQVGLRVYCPPSIYYYLLKNPPKQ